MRVFADLQLHSPYSRATSKNMNLKELAHFASMKGLNLVGTGDCTHPDWRKEIRTDLQDVPGSGLYRLRDGTVHVQYMITGRSTPRSNWAKNHDGYIIAFSFLR